MSGYLFLVKRGENSDSGLRLSIGGEEEVERERKRKRKRTKGGQNRGLLVPPAKSIHNLGLLSFITSSFIATAVSPHVNWHENSISGLKLTTGGQEEASKKRRGC